MKRKLLIFLSFTCINVFGQVGIGTINPQEKLHVAGTTSTIRIEGLNMINNHLNQGVGKLSPVFVTKEGNLTLVKPGYKDPLSGNDLPLNFLAWETNFAPDNPIGHPAPYDRYGYVINSNLSNVRSEDVITTYAITINNPSMIEIKYSLSLYFSSQNLNFPPAIEPNDSKTRVIQTYICVDLNSDGLDATELATKYAFKGQYYASTAGGTKGYPNMNSQAYMSLPNGTHTLYFYGAVEDPINTYTSIGFGGGNDYLKIRMYN